MRKSAAIIVLIAQPLLAFGRNVVFPPDPVGMKVYQANHLTDIVILSIITCALLIGCFWHLLRRKPKGATADEVWSYEI